MQNPASTVLVLYTIKGDKIAEQEFAIREWVGSIQALNDPKVEYSVYKTEDGTSFVHHIQMANGEVGSRPARGRFVGEIKAPDFSVRQD